MSFTDVFKKIFGTKADRDMKAIKPTLDKVLEAYKEIDKLDDDALRARCQALKDKIQAAIAADEARVAEIKMSRTSSSRRLTRLSRRFSTKSSLKHSP